MSNHLSPVDLEANVDQVPTVSENLDLPRNCEGVSNPLENDDGAWATLPNNEEMFSSLDNNGLDDKQSDPLSRKRKACFFFCYSGFVILFLVFFLVIAYTYPLKPVLNIGYFYTPVFDKTPNITQEMKDLVFFQLKFNNRNELISVSYDDFLNITIYYVPNSTTSIYFANNTLPGFYQHKGKPKSVAVQMPAPRLSGLLQLLEAFSTMVFRVDLEFSLRFHCRELGKHKHRFLMTADIEVSKETGQGFEDNIEMSEN